MFIALYPNVLPSTLDPEASLTVAGAAASPYSLGVITVVREGRSGLSLPRPWWQVLRGFAVSLSAVCFFSALQFMPIGEATAILFTSPMMTALLAAVVLHEPLRRETWIASGLAFLGVLLVLRPNFALLGWAALLPMLTLGIPGSPTAAVLLGGLLIWGLQPGPMLFVEQKDFVWGLIASMYLGNIVGLIVVLTTVPWWAAILRIPFSVIAPVIIVICAIGAYTVNNSMFDVVMMLVFGVMGYLFKKLKYPLAPLVLALVLGDMAETSFRQSMLLSQGSLSIFWSNPLVGSLFFLAIALLVWPLWGSVRQVMRLREARAV